MLLNQLQTIYPTLSPRFFLGGTFLYYLQYGLPYANLHTLLGGIGSFLVCSSALVGALLLLTEWRLASFFSKKETVGGLWRYVKLVLASREPTQAMATPDNLLAIRPETNLLTRPSISAKVFAEVPSPKSTPIPKSKPKPTKRDEALKAQRVYNGDFTEYQLPGLDLLTDPPLVDQSSLKKI